MSQKIDLILDIAGVIATNFSPIFWRDLSIKFGVVIDNLIKFRNEIRTDLWTGKIDEQEFWERFLKGSQQLIKSMQKLNYLQSYNHCLLALKSRSGVSMQIFIY